MNNFYDPKDAARGPVYEDEILELIDAINVLNDLDLENEEGE